MKIAIDPGHGMANRQSGIYDPGAIGNSLEEASVALEWALTGKYQLLQDGFEVWLTRDDATTPAPLGQRVKRALAAGCNAYISIHLNASGSPTPTGPECYYRGSEDQKLATIVLQAIHEVTKLPSRGLKVEGQSQHSRLAVLDFPGPACLIELGFVSNAADCKIITDRNTRIEFWKQVSSNLKGGIK